MTVDRLKQRLVAEGIGTSLLLAAVVGSGIMAERLAGGNDGLALLANALATAAALVALILAFGPVSGAHFNPAVTLALAARRVLPRGAVPGYLLAQLAGAVLGVWLAHVMFDLPVMQASTHARTGAGQWAGEFTATFALLSVIWSCARHHPHATPYAVANFTDDVLIFAGCLTGNKEWPTHPSTHVPGAVLEGALAHAELAVDHVQEDEQRPRFHCRVVHEASHAPFKGFNRAQAAVIEAAILASRLHMLPREKVERELGYLQIAVEKTAGPREHEAWRLLVEKIEDHYKHAPPEPRR